MDSITIGILVWQFLPFVFLFLWWRSHKKSKSLRSRLESLQNKYSGISNIEDKIGDLNNEASQEELKIAKLRANYSEKKALFDKLKKRVAVFDEKLAFAEMGVYEPHFDFGDSDTYKDNIQKIRARQKEMISKKTATQCPAEWTVEGSLSKGKTMINRQSRLTMRAFNNECEAAIANARWNNVVALEKRILNAAKQINSANASMKLEISDRFVALKLEELHLTHEYREQLKIEKDERMELARLEREEKKLHAEASAAVKEEAKYQALLDKARREAGADVSKIEKLELALAEAHERTERARAMAEMTRTGYVYVISNIGSFGEEIVKIGLTRRLDPYDRVKELGDASVPFGFDTHAMIYSKEAPALEAALHREFEEKRVNASNRRKEFFNVSLDDVKKAVIRLSPEASFHTDREAQEWHETLAMRSEALTVENLSDDLPSEI